MKKRSLLDKLLARKTRDQDESREYVAEQLEARILYSAAPVDAAPDESAHVANADVKEVNFKEIDDFGGAAEVVEQASDSSLNEYVTLTSFDNLTDEELATLADAAVQKWIDSGISDEQLAALQSIEYDIVDLDADYLGATEGYEIEIDINAAGEGWFVDATPFEDEEFGIRQSLTTLRSGEGAASYGMDLLTVLMHEQGHVLGLHDLDASDWDNLMHEYLETGERRLISENQADGIEAGTLEGTHYLTAQDDSYDALSDELLDVSAEGGLLANDDAGSGNVVTTGNLTLDYNANNPDDVTGTGPFTWVAETGNANDDFVFNANVTYDSVTGGHAGITNTFTLTNGGATNQGLNDLAGDPSDNSATWEFWIKPDAGTDRDRLYETGGSGDGMAVYWNGNTGNIDWIIDDGNVQQTISGGVGVIDLSKHNQITLVYAKNDSGSNDRMELYVNGQSVAVDSSNTILDDFDGGDTASLGQTGTGLAATANAGGDTNYEGQLSIFRFYEAALTAEEVTANYNAILTPAPAVINAGANAGSLNTTGNPIVGGGSTFTTERGAIVTVMPDGSFSYDPTDGLSGAGNTDSFVYEVRDFAAGVTEQKTVTVNVDAIPVSGVTAVTVSEEDTVSIDVIETQLRQLTNLDANASIIQLQRYGYSVAVDGDLAVVGSDDTGDTSYVLVYERNASGIWEFSQAIEDPDGVNSNDDFGYDVAVDGQTNTIVVGSYSDDNGAADSGSVYIFSDTDGDKTWVLSQEFNGTSSLPGIDGSDRIGISVDIQNDGSGNLRIVAGADLADTWNPATGNIPAGSDNFGAVYVFQDDSTGTDGTGFVFEQRLLVEDLNDFANDDNLGRGVRIDGSYIVASSANDDEAGTNHGAAYVFQLDAGASRGVIEIDNAGVPVANAGLSFASVGGVNNDLTIQYVVGGSGTGATTAVAAGNAITVTLASVDGIATTATAADVKAAIEADAGTNALVTVAFTGADGSGVVSGTNAITFGQWYQTAKLVNPVAIANSDNLTDVSVTSSSQVDGKARIIAGINTNDFNGTNAGAALIYVEETVGNWVLEDILQSEVIGGDDRFGLEVDISGDTALIGAFADDANGETNRGSAYLFQQDTSQASALIVRGANNSGVRVYLDDTSAIGNVSVSFIDPGTTTAATTASLNGTVIEITLSHDGTAVTATALDVAAAINAAALTIDLTGFGGSATAAISAETPSGGNGLTLGNGNALVEATATPVTMTAHWSQQAMLEGSGSGDINDREQFGRGLALGSDGADGLRIFAGSPYRDTFLPGQTITINGEAQTVKLGELGGAHVFEATRTDIAGTVSEVQQIKPEEIADATNHILSRITSVNQYGMAVDISGDIAVVAAPGGGGQSQQEFGSIGDDTGDVYVFQRDGKGTFDTSDDTWTLLQTLRAENEPGAQDDFGRDVAISEDGSTIAIGAPLLDHNNTYTEIGAVYVFSRSDDGTYFQDAYMHFTTAFNDNGQDEFNRLGFNLDISADGSRIIAGAHQEEIDVDADGTKDNTVGAVYIFDRPGGVGTWDNKSLVIDEDVSPDQPVGVMRLVAADSLPGDQYGRDVAISDDGNRIVVGAFGSDTGGTNRGALYTYDLSDADSANWQSTEDKFQPAGIADNDQLGLRMGLGGDGGEWLVASGHLDDGNGTNAGVVYIYNLVGGAYELQQELSAVGSGATLGNAEFGRAVSINEEGSLIAVGSRVNDTFGTNVGAVFLFEFDSNQAVGAQWVLKDGPIIDETRDARGVVDGSDEFGRAIAISGATVLAGGFNADYVFGDTDVRNYGSVAVFDVSPQSPQGGSLSVKPDSFGAIVNGTNPGRTNNGSLSVVGGEVVFNPGRDFDDLERGESEVVTFTYTLEDAVNGLEGSGTISVTVQGYADTVAQDDAFSITENETSPAVNLLADNSGGVVAGATLDFIADVTQTAGVWTGTGGSFAGDTANGVTLAATTSAYSGITHSYTLPGNDVQVPTNGDRGLEFSGSFGGGTGASGTAHTSWELWIRPTDLNGGNQVLAETGGGTGMGLFLNNSLLELRRAGGGTSGNNVISYDITGLENEFIQVVGVNEIGGDTILYVNGQEVARGVDAGGTDWDGGDGAALGTRGEANMGGVGGGSSSRVSFAGEIAIFRVYNATEFLDASGVQQNFHATAGGDLNITGVSPFEVNAETVTSAQGISVDLNTDGTFVYNSGTAFDNLAAGEVISDNFTYNLVDSTGTVTLNITGENDAPVLDNSGAVTFTGIDEDATTNPGNLVSELLDLAGTPLVTDVDDGAVFGIAITAATINSGTGTWEFSIDAGGSWAAVGTPTEFAALLLRAEDRIRFVPDAIDAATADIQFKAWDQSDSLVAGTTVNVQTNGGVTAFSTSTETASIVVTAVNENPVATDDILTASNQVTLNAQIITADNGNGADSDEEPGILTVATVNGSAGNIGTSIDTAKGGRFTVQSDGSLTYEIIGGSMAALSGGATETDSVTYTIMDANGGVSNLATATVTVVGANKPTGGADSYTANEDTPLFVPDGAGDLLDNDTISGADPADLPLTVDISASDTLSSAGAALVYTGTGNDGDGGFTYDATNSALIQSLAAGETYDDTFTYVVQSARGVPDSVTVTVTVTGEGPIEINTAHALPPGITGAAPGDPVTVDLVAGEVRISVNGVVLRDPANIGNTAVIPDISITGTGGSDTITINDLSSKTLGAVTVDSTIDEFHIDGAISAASLTSFAEVNNIGANVTTSGNQGWNSAVVIDGNATLTGVDIVFSDTVEDDGAGRDLVVNASGIARIMNSVGATNALGSLDTSSSASTELGTGYATVAGDLVWNFDFSRDPDTGDNEMPDLSNTVSTSGTTFRLLQDTDAAVDPTFIDISDVSGHVGLTRGVDFGGGATTVNGDGGLRIQQGTADSSPDAVSGLTNGPATFDMWVKFDEIGSAASPASAQMLWETGGGTGWGLALSTTGTLILQVAGGGATATYDLANDPDNQVGGAGNAGTSYIHIAATIDLDTSPDTVTLYLNGEQVGQGTGGDTTDWDGGDPSALGAVGGANSGGFGNSNQDAADPDFTELGAVGGEVVESFNGQMALFRMFEGILSQADIQANMALADIATTPGEIEVITSGAQNFGDTILGLNANLSGSEITFSGTLDDDGSSADASNLSITTSTGDIVFNGAAGGNDVITSLDATATAGIIHVHGGSVTTTLGQTYNTSVHSNATGVAYSGSDLIFADTLTSVGTLDAVAINSISVAGSADLQDASTFSGTGVTFNDTVTIGGDITVTTSDDATFTGAVTGPTHHIVANVDDRLTFTDGATVGSITSSAAGRSQMTGDFIFDSSTTDSVFLDRVNLLGDTTFTTTGSADLIFGQTVDGASSYNLGITLVDAASTARFFGDIGGDGLGADSIDTGLAGFNATGAGTVAFEGKGNILAGLPIPVLNFNAGFDSDGAVWEDLAGNMNLSSSGVATISSASTAFGGLVKTYTTNGGKAVNTATNGDINSIGGNPTDEDATIEWWIRPSDLVGKEIIWETGGTGSGQALVLNEGEILFTTKEGEGANTVSTVSYDLGADASGVLGGAAISDDFIHVVVVYDRVAASGALEDDVVTLFINGTQVDTDIANLDDIAGTDRTGLGGAGNSTGGSDTAATTDPDSVDLAGYGNFNDDIAVMRWYKINSSAATVGDMYSHMQTGQQLNTTGVQSIGTAVTLGGNLEMSSSGGGDISLNGPVDGTYDLSINTGGSTNLGGVVGGTTELKSITADGGGSAAITANVSTTGDQTFNEPATTTGDLTLSGSNVNFLGGLNVGAGSTDTVVVVGNLAVAGDLTIEVNGVNAGEYDVIDVTGEVNITGASLNPSGGVGSAAELTIISNDGADTVTGGFAGLAEGGAVTINGQDFVITYSGDSGNDVVLKPANTEPTISGSAAGQSVDDNATISPFSAVTIGDADTAQSLTVTVTLDDAAKGSFTAASLTATGFTDETGGVYQFVGTAAAATSAIQALVFDPVENRVEVGQTETTVFTIAADDGVAAVVSDNTTTVASTSINDDPTVANAIVDQNVDQDVSFAFTVSANTFADADLNDDLALSASGLPAWLSFNNATGEFTGNPVGSDVGDSTVTVTATDESGRSVSDQFVLTVNDTVAPAAISFSRLTPLDATTNADTLVFRVTFSEDVQNVTQDDFTVSGVTGATLAVSGSGNVYDVTVVGGNVADFSGDVGLDFAGTQNIQDLSGNSLPGTEPATDEVYTLDNIAPTTTGIVRQTPGAETTNADSLTFLVSFSENVANVTQDDFVATGVTGATLVVTPGSDASEYEVTVSGGDLAAFNGAVGLNISGSRDILDSVGNALSGGEPTTDETYTLDNVLAAPTLNPVDDSAGIAINTNLVLSFAENVSKVPGGNITIHLASDDSVVQTIAVSDAVVNVSGGTVTVNPADLLNETEYYINIPAGAFVDDVGNSFAGISDSTSWSFTTAAPLPEPAHPYSIGHDPFLTGSNPANGEYAVGGFAGGSTNPTVDGFTGAWAGGTGTWKITASGLDHGSIIDEAGGSAIFNHTSNFGGDRTAQRDLTNPPVDTEEEIWTAGLVQMVNTDPDNTGYAYGGFGDGSWGVNGPINSEVGGLFFGIEGDGTNMDLVFRHRTASGVMTSEVLIDGITPAETYLVIMKVTPNTDNGGVGVDGDDNVSIWVNPANPGSEGLLGTPTATFEDFSVDTNSSTFTDLMLGANSGLYNSQVKFDEMAIGTTLEQVVNVDRGLSPDVVADAMVTHTEGAGPEVVSPGLILTDADGGPDASQFVATASIGEGFVSGEDHLAVNPGVSANIITSISGDDRTVTFTAANSSATIEEFQAALRLVTFEHTGDAPDPVEARNVTFTYSDGLNVAGGPFTLLLNDFDDDDTYGDHTPTLLSISPVAAGSGINVFNIQDLSQYGSRILGVSPDANTAASSDLATAIANDSYIEFVVGSDGETYSLDNLSFDISRGANSGIRGYGVFVSTDGFSTTPVVGDALIAEANLSSSFSRTTGDQKNVNVDLAGAGFEDLTTDTTVRIYIHTDNVARELDFDNFQITGTIGTAISTNVTITPTNDDPTPVADSAVAVEEGAVVYIPVLNNDVDPDNDPLILDTATLPATSTNGAALSLRGEATALVGITTDGSAEQNLVDVIVTQDGADVTYTTAELVGITQVAYSYTGTDGGSTTALLTADGAGIPDEGARAGLAEDDSLVTGIINADNTFGQTVKFDQGVSSVLFFELGASDNLVAEVSVDGVNWVSSIPVDFDNWVTAAGTTVNVTYDSGRIGGATTSLSELESADISVAGGATVVVGGQILKASDFGVETFSYLRFGGPASIDPTLIKGIATQIVYNPTVDAAAAGQVFNDTFTYEVSDGNGGRATQTVTVGVTGINDAPGANDVAVDTTQGDVDPAGTLISTLYGTDFLDPDTGDTLSGIAVTGGAADAVTEGVYQYSLDSGVTWNTITAGATDDTIALMLDSSTQIRFLSVPSFVGTPGTLSVRVLDDSFSGSFTTNSAAPEIADVSVNGGETAIAGTASELGANVADLAAPTHGTLSPADNSTGIALDTDLEITFSEDVRKGTGVITIHLAADGSVVQSIDVNDAAVTVSGDTVTINPTANLVAGLDYYVNIPAGAIEDIGGNDFAGFNDATSWNFTTVGLRPVTALVSPGFDTEPDPDGQTLTAIIRDGIVYTDLQGAVGATSSSGGRYGSDNEGTPASVNDALTGLSISQIVTNMGTQAEFDLGTTVNDQTFAFFIGEIGTNGQAGDAITITPLDAAGNPIGDFTLNIVAADYGEQLVTMDTNHSSMLGTRLTSFTLADFSGTGTLTGVAQLRLSGNTGYDPNVVGTFRMVDEAGNQAPVIASSAGSVTVEQGGSAVIPAYTGNSTVAETGLIAVDFDDVAANLTYTVTGGPAFGTIQLNGSDTTTFTQEDLNNGLVTYLNNGGGAGLGNGDSFTFAVSDDDGATSAAASFALNVLPVNGDGVRPLTNPGAGITVTPDGGGLDDYDLTFVTRDGFDYSNIVGAVSATTSGSGRFSTDGTTDTSDLLSGLRISNGVLNPTTTDFMFASPVNDDQTAMFFGEINGSSSAVGDRIYITPLDASGQEIGDWQIILDDSAYGDVGPAMETSFSGGLRLYPRLTSFLLSDFNNDTGTLSGVYGFRVTDAGEDGAYVDPAVAGTFNISPEIEVTGNGQVIADGDSTPDAGDGTDFGTETAGDFTITRTFTITNSGFGPLDLAVTPVTISGSTDFTISLQPADNPVAPGGTTTFEVTFDPTTTGTQSATISIGNNDSDENPYTFDVSAEVTPAKAAPEGADITLTVDQDDTLIITAADFGFSDTGDTPSDNFIGVVITSLPASGFLTLNGTAVSAGDFISIADINANLLTFDPVAGESGTAYADFTFQVLDDGLGSTPTTGVVPITSFTTAEGFVSGGGGSQTLTSFTDAGGTYTDLTFVTSVNGTLPGGNSILHGTGTAAPTNVASMTDDRIDTGILNPSDTVIFEFDDPLKISDKIFVFTNDTSTPPLTIQAHDGTSLIGLQVSVGSAIGGLGSLDFERNGSGAILSDRSIGGFSIEVADLGITDTSTIKGIKFTGTGSQDYNLIGFASAPVGENTDPSPNTTTIDVTPAKVAPAGTDTTLTIDQDTTLTITASDFGFGDPGDTPSDDFIGVVITTPPAAGTLSLDGVAVSAGDFVTIADLGANKLTFEPVAGESGGSYGDFTFQVVYPDTAMVPEI
ncbi:MAG: Ig-like domain-containing protein, partial [Verrucomicrobiales bacterium]|nr:Ig-like domain-containing protein [Verrucomicrobiales bacterium]